MERYFVIAYFEAPLKYFSSRRRPEDRGGRRRVNEHDSNVSRIGDDLSCVAGVSPACPMPKVAPSTCALIVVLAAPPTALVHIAVFGVFDMPIVPKVQFAQQSLDHGSLRFNRRTLYV